MTSGNAQAQRSARRTYGLIHRSSSSNFSSSSDEQTVAMTDNTQDESSPTITITVLDSAQNKFTIEIPSNATVAQLKTKGALVHSIPPAQQRLISMGQLLQDDKFLSADHNITNGSIVHLFPKPNVVITDSNASSSNGDDPDTSSNSNNRSNATTASSPGAHVPQIVMDAEEVNRRSSLLVLSTHEAYEALHRIRLLSFLLLIYSSIQLLRDVSIWLGPPDDDDKDHDRIIPPGDPTDTSLPGQNEYEPELPEWQNRDYVEMAICALGMYVALLGIKATSEHIGYLARRFVVLLGVLGVSWNAYLVYCYVQELTERETDEDLKDGKVYQDALLADSLPLFLWLIFYLRAMQFYHLIREAESDAQERSRSLTSAMVTPGGDGSGEGGHDETNTNESSDPRRNDYDLELQVEERSIT